MGWDTILFDLDGTLTDPKEGITKAVAVALEHFGIHEDPDNLTSFIGPPLDESFIERFGFNEDQIIVGIEKFRAYFSRQGWLENIPYPGMTELLRELKAAGKHLLIATSKPEQFAVQILEHFGMAEYFDHICGAPMDEHSGAKKSRIIENALSYYEHGPFITDAVMVGDRKHDVLGAHEKGLSAVGVLYGYGDRQELEEAGADFIVETIDSLKELLLFDAEVSRRWFRAFAPHVPAEDVHRYTFNRSSGSCMWTALGGRDCLSGAEAKRAFDAQKYERAIIFRAGFDGMGKTCKITAAQLDQNEEDVYVVDEDFRWTYVHTHEDGWCGPYFCRNNESKGDG